MSDVSFFKLELTNTVLSTLIPVSVSVRRYPILTNVLSLFYHLDNVDCSGDEDRLSECEHNEVAVLYCSVGYNEAGVICNCMFLLLLFERFNY